MEILKELLFKARTACMFVCLYRYIYRPNYMGLKLGGGKNGNYFPVVFLICLNFGTEGWNGCKELFFCSGSQCIPWWSIFLDRAFLLCGLQENHPEIKPRCWVFRDFISPYFPLHPFGCKSLKYQLYVGLLQKHSVFYAVTHTKAWLILWSLIL